jgi:hypothetical protein
MSVKYLLAAWAGILSIMAMIAVRSAGAAVPHEVLEPGSSVSVNIFDHGVLPDDGMDDTAAINNAIKACSAGKSKTLVFPSGTINLSTVTFPKEINVVMLCGTLLQIDKDATIRFEGPFNAGLYTLFSNTGRVHFGNAAVQEVYPQWWTSPGGDDSFAIKKAVDAGPGLPGITVRLVGTFHCRTPIVINRHRAHLLGTGRYATYLLFDPVTDGPLFEFKMDDKKMVVQSSIKDLSLMGAGGNKKQKIGIRIVDGNMIEVRNVDMQRWFGKQSIGLQIQGRQLGWIENISIRADLPISIEKNPNINWIAIDHFTFRNTYLLVEEPNNPAVRIGSGVSLTNVLFDGNNAWTTSKYGIYWKDTESKGTSLNLVVKNVRMEQGKARGGHIIHIDHNFALQNLILENIYGCNGGPGGIYLRRCSNVTLENIIFTSDVYDPQPMALDIDETCGKVVLINSFWNTGRVSTGNLVKTFATRLTPQRRSRPVEVYDRPRENTPEIEGLVVNGTRTWSHSGTLAKGKAMSLPIGPGLGTRVATITVSASDGKTINESAQFMTGSAGRTVLVAGTERVKAETVQGNLCLVSGNQVQLINYFEADVDVVVTVNWN